MTARQDKRVRAAIEQPGTSHQHRAAPPGERLILSATVERGSQVYACAAGGWALKGPVAVLASSGTDVLHQAGPRWTATADSSFVSAAAQVASVAVPGSVAATRRRRGGCVARQVARVRPPRTRLRTGRHSVMTPKASATPAPSVAEARAVGIASPHDWPYGPYRDYQARRELVNWATAHRLRYNPRGNCLDWLRQGRCPDSVEHWEYAHRVGGWRDHVTGWTRDGQPVVLVGQPYGLGGGQLAELAEIDRSGLAVLIDGTGWYGHGTTFVTVWRDEPERRRTSSR